MHSHLSLLPQMDSDGFRWTCCLCQKDPIICAFYPVITPALPGWIIIRHHTEKWKASVYTHTHGYCLCVQLLVELPGRVLSKLGYESRNGDRRTLQSPELLGQCLKWCVRAHRAHKLSFGFCFVFFLCCLKPDDMHTGVTYLLELVVEYKVRIVQQGEEPL